MTISTHKVAIVLFELLILSLGFGMINIDVGYALKPYMLIMLLAFVFLLITHNFHTRKILAYEKSWLLFMIVCCGSILHFTYFESNLRYIIGFAAILLYYFTISNLLRLISMKEVEESISKVGIVICIITLIYYCMGVVRAGFNFHGNGIEYFGLLIDRNSPRLISLISNDPNITALYMTLFLFIYIKGFSNNFRNKLGTLLTIVIIVLTFSRGAYLALAAAFILRFIFSKGKTIGYKLKIALRCLIVVAIIVLISEMVGNFNVIDIITSRFESATTDNGSGRMVLWQNAIKTFENNMLFGIGINSSLEYNYIRYGTTNYVHNTYLEVLSETGIIGTIPYIVFIIGILIYAVKVYKKDSQYDYLLWIFIALLFQMIFLSVLLNEMFYTCVAILTATFLEHSDKMNNRGDALYERQNKV